MARLLGLSVSVAALHTLSPSLSFSLSLPRSTWRMRNMLTAPTACYSIFHFIALSTQLYRNEAIIRIWLAYCCHPPLSTTLSLSLPPLARTKLRQLGVKYLSVIQSASALPHTAHFGCNSSWGGRGSRKGAGGPKRPNSALWWVCPLQHSRAANQCWPSPLGGLPGATATVVLVAHTCNDAARHMLPIWDGLRVGRQCVGVCVLRKTITMATSACVCVCVCLCESWMRPKSKTNLLVLLIK